MMEICSLEEARKKAVHEAKADVALARALDPRIPLDERIKAAERLVPLFSQHEYVRRGITDWLEHHKLLVVDLNPRVAEKLGTSLSRLISDAIERWRAN